MGLECTPFNRSSASIWNSASKWSCALSALHCGRRQRREMSPHVPGI
jgi:hypothetical protein